MYDQLQVKALERMIESVKLDWVNGNISSAQRDALIDSYERDIARVKRGE